MTACECVFDPALDEVCELKDASIETAERGLKCNECYRDILPGERYLLENYETAGPFSIYEDSGETHNTCLDCMSIRDYLACNYYIGTVLDDVGDSIEYADGAVSEDCMSKLTPRAREWACEVIEGCWREVEEDGNG